MLFRSSIFPSGKSCIVAIAVVTCSAMVGCRIEAVTPTTNPTSNASADEVPATTESPIAEPKPKPSNQVRTTNEYKAVERDTLFDRLPTDRTGIDLVNRIVKDHAMSRLYISGFASGGVAIGDVDNDGLPDVYLSNGPENNRLYRQTGDLKFEDITERAGVAAPQRWSAGCSFADVDNDGDLDLHVCNYDSPNMLFINDGTGVFADAAIGTDAAVADASVMAHFCDYDRDGDLDYFLLTNRLYREGGLPTEDVSETVDGKLQLLPEFQRYYHLIQVGPKNYTVKTSGRPNRLFQNDGQGNFKDVSAEAGITEIGKGLSAIWYDYDLDGRMDIYVANDFDDPDHLYRNNGNGTFTDVITQVVPHTTWFSMGSDSADLNNDGMMDLMVLDMSATTHYRQKVTMGDMSARQHFMDHSNPRQLMRNAVFLNPGVGRLMETAHMSGLASSDWSWAVKLADFDNDGWNDAFITNGMTTDMTNADRGINQSDLVGREEWQLVKNEPPQRDKNLAFKNSGQYKFRSVGEKWGIDHEGMSYSAAYGDLDRDGDLDLIVSNLDEPVHVYRNNSNAGNGITLSLKGKTNNRFGIGATVRLQQGDGEQVRVLNPMSGFMSCNEPIIHFGLGNKEKIDRVHIEWPNGTKQVANDLAIGKHHEIAEATVNKVSERGRPPLIFKYVNELQSIRHTETPYDDFEKQPLLPNKLSQLGPGIAFGDANGDGLNDVYVGSAKGADAAVYVRGTTAGPTPLTDSQHSNREEFGSLFFDADGDGDQDLYVVAGGVESDTASTDYRDKLYLNDGRGQFTSTANSLPEHSFSGSVVAAADFDRDGDLDLFVGGRVVPGAYPTSPGSQLLRNESQRSPDFYETLGIQLEIDDSEFGDNDPRVTLPIRLLRKALQKKQNAADDSIAALERTVPQGANYSIDDGVLKTESAEISLSLSEDSAANSDQTENPLTTVTPHENESVDHEKLAGEMFRDVTRRQAPQLRSAGMVTSAIWSDINSDGWIDLVVTTEWGPIRTFLNRSGKLQETTHESGLEKHLGWWNGIAGRDLDNDGDIDFVATNFGLNTKYHPTAEHPSRIYYGTFGDETTPHIVEAKVGDEHILPVRGKSCSQNAMPFVREKFNTYHDFAQASLGDIYSKTQLAKADIFEANWLETSVLWNDGTGKFELETLPALAQISPAFGVVTTDLNGDGNSDIYLVQNFYHPQRETGKMAGGMSVLYYGDGSGSFSEIWPKESGLAVAADAKGLATCDLNDDAWADFAITINDGPTLAFQNQNDRLTRNRCYRIRFKGVPGNPTAVGARVQVKLSNGATQTDEVRAGGGYLSQSSSDLFFGAPEGTTIESIHVRWPDGDESRHSVDPNQFKIEIAPS